MKKFTTIRRILYLFVLLLFFGSSVKAQDNETTSTSSNDTKAFAMVGYATLNYEASGGESGFISATYNPIFVYKVNNKLSFNAELEVEVEDEWDGGFALEFAEFNYQINNNLAFYGGKFLSPIGTLQSRYHPAWINKSINLPIGLQNEVNGLKRTQGDSELGLGFRGGVNNGGLRLNYNVFLTNGPGMNDDGSVEWDNSGGDFNNSPAFGARIGILPFANSTFEVGISGYYGKAGDTGIYPNANVTLLAFDLNWVKQTSIGIVSLKGQLNDQMVSDENYPGTVVPLQDFTNTTTASYVELSDRIGTSNFELAYRFSNLNVPNEVTWGADQTRNTITLNYWLNWNAAIRVGYDIINNDDDIFGLSVVMGL